MNNQQNDDMDRQTLNVAFATQKGGSGKTAITVLVAGYLHYRLGCPLAVIDCDFPQYSLYEMRERDSRAVLENEYLKRAAYEQMRQPGRAAYPVRKCRVEQAPDTARELAAEGCYDLLFFDLPGTVNSAGILRTIAQMDYIFAPVSADKAVLESTLSFLDVLQRMMLGKETSRLKGLYLFWNQVDKRETSGLLREVRAGGRRHGAADAANPHPRHETLPQGGGRHGTDGVPLHAAGSRQADAGRQRHSRTDP